jgi:YD repeat-containing protein
VENPLTGRTLHFRRVVSSRELPLAAITDHNGIVALRLLTGPSGGGPSALGPAGGVVFARFGHDEAGHLTEVTRSSGPPSRFTYDAQGRLTGWADRNGFWYRYDYDERGRGIRGYGSQEFFNTELAYSERVTVVTDSLGGVLEQTDFTWDGVVLQTHSVRETPSRSRVPAPRTTTWDYEPGTFTPLTQVDRVPAPMPPERPPAGGAAQDWYDERFYGIVTDLVGAPTEMVDAAGNIAWRHRQTLWGMDAAPGPGNAHCPLRFPGQYFDAESRLHYNFHRYYDPARAPMEHPIHSASLRRRTRAPMSRTHSAGPTLWASRPTSRSASMTILSTTSTARRREAPHTACRARHPRTARPHWTAHSIRRPTIPPCSAGTVSTTGISRSSSSIAITT